MNFRLLQKQGLGYSIAILCVLLAAIARMGVEKLEINSKFLPFFVAVLASTALAGWKPGALAAVLGAAADFFYFRRDAMTQSADSEYLSRLFLFLAASVIVIGLVELQRVARRRAEALVKELQTHIAHHQQTEKALAVSNRRLALIAHVTNAVLGDEPLSAQMRNVAETVRTSYGVDACIIRLLEESKLVLLSCAGIESNVLAPVLPANCALSRELFKRRAPIFVRDLRTFKSDFPDLPPPPNPAGFVSYVGAPLLAQDKIIGVMGIFTREPMDEFNPVELQHLQVIANHMAVAIANARLYQQIKLQKSVLEQEVRERHQAELEVQTLNADLELRVQERTRQLELSNGELEAFAYSVSHDLRGPLRSVVGFAEALKDESLAQLTVEGRDYLDRIFRAGREMDELIDDLLHLSRLTRIDMKRQPVNLTLLAETLIGKMREAEPERDVQVSVAPGLVVPVDPRLMRVAMENLLNNAWKFTRRTSRAEIEFGRMDHPEGPAFYVRDNGAGFDMAFAGKLFGAFQRLHSSDEFPGHGIGLATVQRIIHRHSGRTWATGEVDRGACFYFTLPT